jgi:hypothetical protein
MCNLFFIAYLNQYRDFLINSKRWKWTHVHSLKVDVLYLTTIKQIFVQQYSEGI